MEMTNLFRRVIAVEPLDAVDVIVAVVGDYSPQWILFFPFLTGEPNDDSAAEVDALGTSTSTIVTYYTIIR